LAGLYNKTKWAFTPIVQVGTVLRASSVIGTVPERGYTHKIMVPFDSTLTTGNHNDDIDI
jgi:V/A-type H+-transporting ATPase subunit A